MLTFPADTEALLFDCDGTLVDSMPIHISAWQATLADYGVDLPKAFIDDRAGMPTNTIVEHINVEFGVTLDPPTITGEKEARYLTRLDEVLPIQPVLDTARSHHAKLAMAVVSGSVRSVVLAALETVDAMSLFPVIVTADDPVAAKPSPDVFLEAARQLGVRPERCHVFEDGDYGITAAQAAGMTWTDVRELV